MPKIQPVNQKNFQKFNMSGALKKCRLILTADL